MVDAELEEQTDQSRRRIERGLVGPVGPVLGTWVCLDDRERERHSAAGVDASRRPRQEVTSPLHHRGVDRAGRSHRGQGDFLVDRQAGRASLVWLESVAESAVAVLIAAKDIDDPVGRPAQEAGSMEPLLKQTRVARDESIASSQDVVHTATLRGCDDICATRA